MRTRTRVGEIAMRITDVMLTVRRNCAWLSAGCCAAGKAVLMMQ